MSNNGYSGLLKNFWRKRRDNLRFCTLVEQGVKINLKYCQVLYGFNYFFPRIITSPHECILAGASGVAQQLSIDTCKNS